MQYLFSQVPQASCRWVELPQDLLSLLVKLHDQLLDLTNLDGAIQELFYTGLAASTRPNYQSHSRKFLSFCTQFNLHTPFPVTEHTLTAFVTWLYSRSTTTSLQTDSLRSHWAWRAQHRRHAPSRLRGEGNEAPGSQWATTMPHADHTSHPHAGRSNGRHHGSPPASSKTCMRSRRVSSG